MIGLTIGIKDVIDILLVALIFYEAYRLLRHSGAANLFWGIFAFVIAWVLVSYIFGLELTGAIFDRIISGGAIALIIIFQEEIRAFFYRLGGRFSNVKIFRARTTIQIERDRNIHQLVLACGHMSDTKTGALIVLCKKQDLSEYSDTGEEIDAGISARMIENIFFKNTPLHDGALIIRKGRLQSAACILPVSKRQDLPQSYGLRHRAALGLTEKTDALAIVVSEETGHISVAESDHMESVNIKQLLTRVTQFASGI